MGCSYALAVLRILSGGTTRWGVTLPMCCDDLRSHGEEICHTPAVLRTLRPASPCLSPQMLVRHRRFRLRYRLGELHDQQRSTS
ncbi:hypothetical protein BD414DRAFT_484623 [Trametes punicea]|nr:hypothetical protein BD414DRAFT_484623 [Trametes punicea]